MEAVVDKNQEQAISSAERLKAATLKANRFMRAAEIIQEAKAEVREMVGGSFGVKLVISGVRDREVCEMVAKDLNDRLVNLGMTTICQSSEILSQASEDVRQELTCRMTQE